MRKGQVFSTKLLESVAWFDQKSSCWKMFETSFLVKEGHGCEPYLQPLPKSGMMRNGKLYERQMLEPCTAGQESGLWPTPDCQNHRDGTKLRKAAKGEHAVSLHHAVKIFPTPRASDSEGGKCKLVPGTNQRISKAGIKAGVKLSNIYGSGQLFPGFVEWLQGYPKYWTDLERPTETFYGWPEEEPNVPRVATGIKERTNKLKCLGNAVVPQCVELVGRLILKSGLLK